MVFFKETLLSLSRKCFFKKSLFLLEMVIHYLFPKEKPPL